MYDKIIEYSTELLIEQGFSKFSIDLVSQTMNVKRGIVSFYFANEKELLQAILKKSWENYIVNMENIAEQNIAPKEKLLSFLNFENAVNSTFSNIVLILKTSLRIEIQSIMKEGYERIREILIEILNEGKAKGDFHFKFEEKALANFIFTTVNGIGLEQVMVGSIYDSITREEIIDILAFLVVSPDD